jgi:hypothetical protein
LLSFITDDEWYNSAATQPAINESPAPTELTSPVTWKASHLSFAPKRPDRSEGQDLPSSRRNRASLSVQAPKLPLGPEHRNTHKKQEIHETNEWFEF